jgi:hypothetical protein
VLAEHVIGVSAPDVSNSLMFHFKVGVAGEDLQSVIHPAHRWRKALKP